MAFIQTGSGGSGNLPTNINPGGPSAGRTPYTPPQPGPQQITTAPGYTPDYNNAILNDPGYQAARAAAQKAAASAAAQRTAALRSQLIQYGGLPAGFKDAYGDIDQATLDAAKNNQYSTLAGLQRNYSQSVDQFRRALAARGALQSGDLNYGQNQLDTGLGQSRYDAGNAFGNQVTGDLNAYTGVLDQNAQNLAAAIAQAETNAFNDPANRPSAAQTAALDPGKSSLYGRSVYVGGDGTMYNQDGSVITPPRTYSPGDTSPYIQDAHGRFGF